MIILTDIHGNYETMLALLAKIPQEERDKGIVICGDLIDRGPRSRQVVQYVIDNNIPCVKGNHEQMMYEDQPYWMENGGTQCLISYGWERVPTMYGGGAYFGFADSELKKVFEQHKLWMKELPLYIEFPEIKNSQGRYLVISHSSIGSVWKNRNKPQYKNHFEANALWGRPAGIHDAPKIYNVFGHTPQENGPKIRVPGANIDTGCFYKQPGYGKLTALQFPEIIIYEQENID
jgi:serine/threonine protein phosphatase 1